MKKLYLLIITLVIVGSSTFSQNTAKIHSIFIYNFIKLIEWPTNYKSGTFNIEIVGNDPIFKELSNLSKAKKAGSQTIKVTKINSFNNFNQIHVVYVPRDQSSKIPQIKAGVGNKSTLIISDTKDGIAKGADINFLIVGNKPKFEIKASSAQAKKLKISLSLINLGIKK